MNIITYDSDHIEDSLLIDMEIFKSIKNFRLQCTMDESVDVIIERLNLQIFYKFVLDFNCGNNLPYHNLYHLKSMLLNCYEGSWYSKIDYTDIRGLCVGALFCDFNHSGGKLDDYHNIKSALKGLEIANKYANSELTGLSVYEYEIAESAIKITEYPYKNVPLSITDRIIRDADLMLIYEEDVFVLFSQYCGLKSEIEITLNKSISYNDFSLIFKKFWNEVCNWNSEWALEKAKFRNLEMLKSNIIKIFSDL